MIESLACACWKYTGSDGAINRHIHLGVFDAWDAMINVEIEANPTGGTWNHIVTIPTNKLYVPRAGQVNEVIKDDFLRAYDIFASIKSEEREYHKFIEVKHLGSCPTNKIDRSFFHVLHNQGIDLYNPVRDGYVTFPSN
jgi:hypothetical protein